MAFTKKRIDIVFDLGNGATFPGSNGANQVTITGLRVSCNILKTANAACSECQLRIYGLPPNIYNQLTSIYQVTQSIQKNTVTVKAGIDGTVLPIVFIGQITIAQIDLNSQPDSVMNVIAQTGLYQSLVPIPATPYPDNFDVATAMKSLAAIMKLNFEPNGVNIQLKKMTLTGTAKDQVNELVDATIGTQKIAAIIDDSTLAIYYVNKGRSTQQIPIVSDSQEPAMIGYPTYSNIGIGVRTVYNPNIQYGGTIQVQSSLKVANLNGNWIVAGLSHNLESELPGGKWETEIQAQNYAIAGAQ